MQVEPWMLIEPSPDLLVLVGGVVVQDQMNLQFLGHLTVDGSQKSQELLVTVARQALADHLAGKDVERGKQGGGAVTLVVVGHRLAAALDHRERGLGPVEGLHRRLLVRAQHDRPLGRVQIQTDDVDELVLESRIIRQFERLDPVRLESASRPHALDGVLGDPDILCHRPATPMSLAFRAVVLRQIHNLLDRFLWDRGLAATTLTYLSQPRHPVLGEPCPPVRHRSRRYRQCLRDSSVSHALGRHQQRLGPHHLPMCTRLRARQRLEHNALPIGNLQSGYRVPHVRILSNRSRIICETYH